MIRICSANKASEKGGSMYSVALTRMRRTVTQKYRHHDYLQSVWVHHHLYCPPKQVSDLSSSSQALEMGERH